MTQRIFDVEDAKDMADLWDILREDITKIKQFGPYNRFYTSYHQETHDLIKINWHDKTEITRPIQEATEADIDKLCYFWDDSEDYSKQIGLLTEIRTENSIFKYVMSESICFAHCRRLTKQEVEKLI